MGSGRSPSRDRQQRVAGDSPKGPNSLCFVDTAIARSDAEPDLTPTSQWILFGAAGDSLEISTTPPGALNTSLGAERDSLHNTAAQFRHRVAVDGAIQVWVDLEHNTSDSVAYTMRLVHRGPPLPAVLRATGRTTTLILASARQSDRYAIVPTSLVEATSSLAPWTVAVGTHKVALVGDSLYQLCMMPCTKRDTVELTPSSRTTVRPSSNGRLMVSKTRPRQRPTT